MEELWVAILVFGFATGAYTRRVAGAKGYDTMAWFWGGFLFSIVALIAIVGMPMKEDSHEPAENDNR